MLAHFGFDGKKGIWLVGCKDRTCGHAGRKPRRIGHTSLLCKTTIKQKWWGWRWCGSFSDD